MERLTVRIVEGSRESGSLRTLAERIEASKFLRSSWFDEWATAATKECAIDFVAWVGLLVFERPRWRAIGTIRRILRSRDSFLSFMNNRIVLSVLHAHAGYFDSVEKNPLTKKQREACASDEDATLVIAGAGSGKTSTILAKIGLLLKTGQCSPEEILAISFTNKSAKELADRVKGTLDVDVVVSTFHKLGLRILAQSDGGKPALAPFAADPVEKSKVIDSIVTRLKSDAGFFSRLLDFCAYYQVEPRQTWHFQTLAEYHSWLRNNKIVSLDGVPKKSYQECVIANWLLLNGVPFEYERPFKHPTRTIEHRQYCPDFYLATHDIYIEHFGVDENGNAAPFINSESYRQGMAWKRALHKRYGTSLVETFSWEHGRGTLLTGLEEKLRGKGCTFFALAPEVALEMMNKNGMISRFSELVSTFLTLYKGNGNRLIDSKHSAREKLFLELFDPIVKVYEGLNHARGQIDFEDMIIQATRAVRTQAFISPYRYILIDEFQDISPGRADLVKALRDNGHDCALFVVGDDWQSIYRFTGSDIGGMTRFSETFGATRQVALDTTFRFDDQAAKVSSAFVLKNKVQIPKALGTVRKSTDPSLVLYKRAAADAPLDWALKEITRRAPHGASVLILERYNFHLPQDAEWARLRKRFPDLRLETMSIHAAKGLEADYVVAGLRGGPWGFPSQIVDDVLFEMVLTQADGYPHGEERRLFYVALTRARYNTFLVCETGQDASDFAAELCVGGQYAVESHGVDTAKLACRKCGSGTMLLRDGSNGKFFGCSNYPLCQHTEQTCPKCGEGLLISQDSKAFVCCACDHQAPICPRCKSGQLQAKKGINGPFYGCSNFRDPEIGCRYTENI